MVSGSRRAAAAVEQQRRRGHRTGRDQQQHVSPAVSGRVPVPASSSSTMSDRGQRGQHHALGGEAGHGGRAARSSSTARTPRTTRRARAAIHGTVPFPMLITSTAAVATASATHCPTRGRSRSTSTAEQHAEQRADVVAERDLDDPVDGHPVDEQAPVRRRCTAPPRSPSIQPRTREPAQLAPAVHQRSTAAISTSVQTIRCGQHLDRAGRVEQRPERGEEPPDHVRADALGQTAAVRPGVRRRHSAIRPPVRHRRRGPGGETAHPRNRAVRGPGPVSRRRSRCRGR